jgi:methionine-rich copper-binding protein CopC
LLGTTVIPTNGGNFNSGDGLSAGESYGAILAALSGADQNNGGDSQKTINDLVAGITVSGTSATLDADAQEQVIAGADTASVNGGGETSVVVDTIAPLINSGATASAIDENSGTNQTVYTANATDASALTYSLKPATGDVAAFSINSSSGAVTLTGNPYYESKSSYSFTVVATDAAGNASEQAVSLAINDLDEVAPSITIITDDNALNVGDTALITFTLSEAASDFSMGDISVTGGSLSNFTAVSSTVYTATFTPTANSTAAATVNVAGGTFTDAAGNANTAATQLNMTVDTVAPTVTITTNDSALAVGETATLTFTLSEAASDFALGDISVSGGSLGGFTGSGTVYTATFTPTPNSTTAATVNVAGGTFTDAAGNANTAAAELNMTVDTVAPTVIITTNNSALTVGETATLTFTLSEASIDFILDDISVTGGALSGFNAISPIVYTATFTPTANSTTAATVNVAGNGFYDAARNNSTAATELVMTVDTAAPTLTLSTPGDNATAVDAGSNIVLTFSEAVQAGSGTIQISDGMSDTRFIDITDTSQVTISNNQVTINPTDDMTAGTAYGVTLGSGVLTDTAGNAFAGVAANELDFITTTNVVFDLVQGISSYHSARTFEIDTAYTIYIIVNSNSNVLNALNYTWAGGSNLGADDLFVLVGTGSEIYGPGGIAVTSSFNGNPTTIQWRTPNDYAARLNYHGIFDRSLSNLPTSRTAILWGAGSWSANPNAGHALNQVYLTTMPPGIMTSQGLVP